VATLPAPHQFTAPLAQRPARLQFDGMTMSIRTIRFGFTLA